MFNASLITKRAGVLEAHVQLAAALGKHVPNLIIILGNNDDVVHELGMTLIMSVPLMNNYCPRVPSHSSTLV